MKTFTFTTLSAVVLSAVTGCSTATMKVPASVQGSPELKIEGHSGNFKTFKEKDLKIGSYAVTNIDRDWDKKSSTGVGGFSHQKSKKAYRFDVTGQSRTLHGECTEQGVDNSIAGFSKSRLSFGCACTEGDSERAKLDLANGEGTAQLGEAKTFNVTTVYESEQGAMVSAPLGYQFRGPQASGAVDVSNKGRAWLPPGMSEDEAFGLVCSYAGLLLYRP